MKINLAGPGRNRAKLGIIFYRTNKIIDTDRNNIVDIANRIVITTSTGRQGEIYIPFFLASL